MHGQGRTADTADDGERVIAWDISTSGIADNCQGDIWNFCQGQTIFGMTSTTGTSVISYIGFQSSVEDYLAAVGINIINENDNSSLYNGIYDLSGRRISSGTDSSLFTLNSSLKKGIYDLSGRRISSGTDSSLFTHNSSLKKGFYVANGHKVMVK